MDFVTLLEYVALLTGLVYMVLQVLQRKLMWHFNIASSLAAIVVAVYGHLWALSAIHSYFVVMSLIGLFAWSSQEKADAKGNIVRLKHLTLPTAIISVVIILAGGTGLYFVLLLTSDPSPLLDASSFILSIVATWWLTRYHIGQWHLWIAADAITCVMLASQGLWGMFALYVCYIVSAVIGLVHWRRHGEYVQSSR